MKRKASGFFRPTWGRRVLVVTSLLLTAGCAYNYAGNEGKVRQDPRPDQSVEVVKLKKAEESTSAANDETAKSAPVPTTIVDSQSPCGVERFTVFEFSSTKETQSIIDCESKRIVTRDESRIAGTPYAKRRARGLPVDQAYILVDPYGKVEGVLTNDHLLKLSREFAIEFYAKTQDGLLIYLFHEEPPTGPQSSRRSSPDRTWIADRGTEPNVGRSARVNP